jgi:histidine triad (HIT) family protein
MLENSCIFCRIIRGELPTEIIYQNESCLIIKDKFPKSEIHWLAIPKTHLEDLRAVREHDASLLGATLCATSHAVKEFAHNRPFKLCANNGHEAGQRVFHLHFHILIGTFGEELSVV